MQSYFWDSTLGVSSSIGAHVCDASQLFECHREMARKLLPGPRYLEVLGWIHRLVKPRVYVEIGVHKGASLRLAHCRSIGIDPKPLITEPVDAEIYEVTSDTFFEGNCSVMADLAFIDGLHTFDQALRDFINFEASCTCNSIIMFTTAYP